MDTFKHPLRGRLSVITNYDYSYENTPDTTIYQRVRLEYKPVSRPLLTWRQECVETARRIKRAVGSQPLLLGLSGGIDSEVMARSFLEAQIDFQALSLRYTDGLGAFNAHDIKHAQEFCAKNKIEHKIVNVDMDMFFDHKCEEYIQQGYRSVNVFRFSQLIILETAAKQGSVAVMAGGEQLYAAKDGVVYLRSSPDFSVPIQWCYDQDQIHFPYFYRQNPEVFAAYMKDPLVDVLLSNPIYYANPVPHHSLEKMLVYHAHFPDMERRKKFNGFERIKKRRAEVQDALRERYPDLNENIYLAIPKIKQQLKIT